MKKNKRILFVSLNAHQKKYFHQLGQFLAGTYQVFHIHYAWANASHAFTAMSELPGGLQIAPEELQQIIEFIQLKSSCRSVGGIQGFFAGEHVLLKQAVASINFFYEYLRENAIDLLCVWNGTLIPLAAAVLVAKKLRRKTLFFENGYLPGTTVVDPMGVNYRNSLSGKPADFYAAQSIDQSRLRAIYDQPPAIRELKSKWYEKFYKKNNSGEPEKIALPAQFVFLPLQVHDDTQILLHSELKSMEQFLDFVIPVIEKFNRQKGTNLQVVVKEHPSDFGRIDYSGLKAKYDRPHVLFLRFYPTPQLVEKAAGVITINSSVGIEALLHHKPVVTVGRAFYNVPGLVTHAQSPLDLTNGLEAMVHQRVDHALIDKFLYYLRYVYLAEGTWRYPDTQHFASVRCKIDSSPDD